MKESLDLPIILSEAAPEQKGVFAKSDLAHLFGQLNTSTLNKQISRLIKKGYLFRGKRGFFYTKIAQLEDLASKIYPNGYLSLETALAYHQMIGNKPHWRCHILTTQPKGKKMNTNMGHISMSCQKLEYQFGYDHDDGRNVAHPEKAFIDTCNFYLRGYKYSFNLSCDVDVRSLSINKTENYLKTYKNPKLKAFVWSTLEANG
jgi:predicted transcriptional regulator of viral defense system